MKLIFASLGALFLVFSGCGRDDGEIVIEEEGARSSGTAGDGVEAGREEPPPGRAKEEEEALPPVIDFRIDFDGRITRAPAGGEAQGGRWASPPGEGESTDVPGSWRTSLNLLEKACEKAPREYKTEPPGAEPSMAERKLPVRLLLRWNPTIGKCKVYVGQVLCNYEESGFERARKMILQLKQTGVKDLEIDAGSDVPASRVLRAVRLEKSLEMSRLYFTGSVDPGGDQLPSPVKKYYGSDERGRYFPDVTVRMIIEAETEWRYVQYLLQQCASLGIYKLWMSGEGEEWLQTYLPIDVGLHAPLQERDVFENGEEIEIEEPPVEDPEGDGEPAQGGGRGPFEGQEYLNDTNEPGSGARAALGGRFDGKRGLRSLGGGRHTETAVLRGLIWLKNHQNPDGRWSCRDFAKNCKKGTCAGPGGGETYDLGVTGLALLAYFGAGHTHKYGKFKVAVKDALKALKESQGPEGCFGPKDGDGHWIYNHAICTAAAAEAYALSNRSPLFHDMAQNASDFLVESQNPYLGWRYGQQTGENDTSCTGWAALALRSAKVAGLQVPKEGFDGALKWFEKVTDGASYKVGYVSRGDAGARLPGATEKYPPGEAMTALALAARIFVLGDAARKRPEILGGGDLLQRSPPRWDEQAGTIDFYYWHFGSLAMFQLGGVYWKSWNESMLNALVPTQRREGCETGSWDPVGAWGPAGGRVYATAINTLTLETYYRYGKVLRK